MSCCHTPNGRDPTEREYADVVPQSSGRYECFACKQLSATPLKHSANLLAHSGAVVRVPTCPTCATIAPQWVPDKTAARCFECSRAFGVVTRRHHCRLCGQVFCNDCSKFRKTIEVTYPKPGSCEVRVCLPCLTNDAGALCCRKARSDSLFTTSRNKDTRLRIVVDQCFAPEENSVYTHDFFARFCRAQERAFSTGNLDHLAGISEESDLRPEFEEIPVPVTPQGPSQGTSAESDECTKPNSSGRFRQALDTNVN